MKNRLKEVLNAFRHLRSIHALASRWPGGNYSRAQRLSASQIHSHAQGDIFLYNSSLCSTPFGISDPFTSGAPARRSTSRACSTPFGISDPFTRRPGSPCRYRRCAQRLSASQIHSLCRTTSRKPRRRLCSTPFGISDPFTRPRRAAIMRSILCSTPFGISDPFTRRASRESPAPAVLNAFRHLRSIHKRLERRCGRRRCAQRLSASQIHSQPMTISLPPPIERVLNAFRHLRSIHTTSRSDLQVSCCVLNAFRHLRSIHMGRLFFHHLGDLVLNAFRHLRSIHSRLKGRSASPPRAQRLSASQIHSPLLGSRIGEIFFVLNAFRHLRSIHYPALNEGDIVTISAQRLSASQIHSQ